MILVNREICDLCGACVSVCPKDCLELAGTYLKIDNSVCIECGFCIKVCPVGAISDVNEEEESDERPL